MRILIACRVAETIEPLVLAENVSYRPDLESKGLVGLEHALRAHTPDVLLVSQIATPSLDLATAVSLAGIRFLHILVLLHREREVYVIPDMGDGITVATVGPDDGLGTELHAFLRAEAIATTSISMSLASVPHHARQRPPSSVALVGAGIVNLMTAFRLTQAGYSVEVFEKNEDPMISRDWKNAGCTFSGEDARIFSLNEARHHHHKGYSVDTATNSQFRKPIGQGGWLACDSASLTTNDINWIRQFESIPQWLSGVYDRDIISFNKESYPLWTTLFSEHPELIVGTGLKERLFRIYPSLDKFERARARESSLGAVLRELSVERFVHEEPCFVQAAANNAIAGVLEVVGFSVQVQRLARNLIQAIRRNGGTFRWNTLVRSIRHGWDDALDFVAGSDLIEAEHVVVSGGAYAAEALQYTKSHDKCAAIFGMWLTLPNVDPPLLAPLKVAREGFGSTDTAEGANIIPGVNNDGQAVIFVSSGHGFVGRDPKNVTPTYAVMLGRAVHETAQALFPSRYGSLLSDSSLKDEQRYCVRPWTPSGLGLFESERRRGGGFTIITGGHNTGGFAQSPAIAEAVVAKLEERVHPMHVLYHPERSNHFLSTARPRQGPIAGGYGAIERQPSDNGSIADCQSGRHPRRLFGVEMNLDDHYQRN